MTNSSIEEDVGCSHTDFPVSVVLFSELEKQPVILGLTIAAGFMCVATVILYFVTLRFLYSHRRLEGIKINKYKVIVMLGLYPVHGCVHSDVCKNGCGLHGWVQSCV